MWKTLNAVMRIVSSPIGIAMILMGVVWTAAGAATEAKASAPEIP
jgi:hypothetical protein